MQKEKKICCRITPRRITGAILFAAAVVNLITVGAVFKAFVPYPAPTLAETETVHLLAETVTFTVSTATAGNIPTDTFVPTETVTSTPTFTATFTPSLTSTATATPTYTNTSTPALIFCTPMDEWPVYIVQPGDWLLAIARATGSSENQLLLANCLVDSRIYSGQKLYVPRLPVTPTVATSTPTGAPTDIRLVGILECKYPVDVFLSVAAYDPQGVQSVVVQFYTQKDILVGQFTMQPDGNIHYGFGAIAQQYTVYDIGYYNFVTVDTDKSVTISQSYTERTTSCDPPLK